MQFFATPAHASLNSFIASVNSSIVNPLITLLFALAVVFFLFGVFQFIYNQENEEKRTAGKMHMLWGVVGIAIMMGVFMILNLILNTFNITDISVDPQGNTNVQLTPYP
ncbi:hypothetical protein A3C67_03265 [Candidatus Nomurabacteria bacterium RIFCSPHIGHO2_02_FULL_42_19]|uniref:Uncharacterized protein n=1 Tax=Candidatus Nomurabacteria bacterium RIFCSPHIGHO2_02_FULL_42_19 TaxID=1801756 RepID=A0A1F6W2U5_9BACT|nr:MAG: hypothetical protein A3C67_03265 [Candidatus Nomurabacteria bacterium RIFCSPHIGHO2_02_FULL_42_19]